MKEAMAFLQKAGTFYLATVDGDQPHVRAMGFVMDCGGRLALCTSNEKKMYRQMVANPKVELCCVDGEGTTLRITGEVEFITTEATQRQALETMPGLGSLYAVGDGKFEIFCLKNARAVCATMSGETKELAM